MSLDCVNSLLIQRDENGVAHTLMKKAILLSMFKTWMKEAPLFLLPSLRIDFDGIIRVHLEFKLWHVQNHYGQHNLIIYYSFNYMLSFFKRKTNKSLKFYKFYLKII